MKQMYYHKSIKSQIGGDRMERSDILNAIEKMLVNLNDDLLKTVYEFVLAISR